jgi:hypothetical protein
MHRKGKSCGDMRKFGAGPVHSDKNAKEAPYQPLAFIIQDGFIAQIVWGNSC